MQNKIMANHNTEFFFLLVGDISSGFLSRSSLDFSISLIPIACYLSQTFSGILVCVLLAQGASNDVASSSSSTCLLAAESRLVVVLLKPLLPTRMVISFVVGQQRNMFAFYATGPPLYCCLKFNSSTLKVKPSREALLTFNVPQEQDHNKKASFSADKPRSD